MVWIFLGLGIALLVVGVLLAVLPTLRADRAHASTEGDEEAWAILSQPVASAELIRLPKDDEKVLGRVLGSKFLQGSIVGAGTSLVVAGIVLSYALVVPGGLSTAEAANPAPKATEPAPVVPTTPTPTPSATKPETGTAAATTTAPTTPKPTGTVAFVISSGQLSQEIAYNLKAQGFIDNQGNFLARLTERGLETAIQIGEFQIPGGATLDQVIDIICHQ